MATGAPNRRSIRLVFSITPDASVRYAKLQKNECQVMPYPNPADIARMKQDKSINLMEHAGAERRLSLVSTCRKNHSMT